MGSTALAISRMRRAAFSGSAKGRGEVYFIRCPFLWARGLVGLSALVAANLAGESRVDIGQAYFIRPAAGVHLDRATADAMHKDFRGAAFAHLAEGVLSSRGMRPILPRIRPSLNSGGDRRWQGPGYVVRSRRTPGLRYSLRLGCARVSQDGLVGIVAESISNADSSSASRLETNSRSKSVRLVSSKWR